MRLLDGITDSMNMGLGGLWEIVEERGAWWAAVYGVAQGQTQLKQLSSSSSRKLSLLYNQGLTLINCK